MKNESNETLRTSEWNLSLPSLRRQAEEKVQEQAPLQTPLDLAEANRIIHELRVHQIELELQNEELRCIQRELQDTQAQYYELYDLAPVGYMSLTVDHLIENINLKGSVLLNQPKPVLLGASFDRFLLPESQDSFYLFIRTMQKSSTPQSLILKVKPIDKDPLWIELEGIRREKPEGIQILFITFQNVTSRIQMEEELRKTAEQREILFRELNHRVKNNLQMISSLMYLQAENLKDPAGKAVLQKLQNRIRSISLIHEMLYKGPDISSVNLSSYMRVLTEELIKQAAFYPSHLEVIYDVEDFSLGVDKTITIGLLMNEILINAIKHAFAPDKKGVLTIHLKRRSPHEGELIVHDNGPGLQAPSHTQREGETLGFQLLEALTQKLGGTLETKNEGGAVFLIRFPL